jgi:hypothetical protein
MKRFIFMLILAVFPQIGNTTITKSGIPDLPHVKLDPSVTIAIESYLERNGRNPKLYSMTYVCQKRGRETHCSVVELESNEQVTILNTSSNK